MFGPAANIKTCVGWADRSSHAVL